MLKVNYFFASKMRLKMYGLFQLYELSAVYTYVTMIFIFMVWSLHNSVCHQIFSA